MILIGRHDDGSLMTICPSSNGTMADTTRIALYMASCFLACKCLDTIFGAARYALFIVIRSMHSRGGGSDLYKRVLVNFQEQRDVTPLFHA